MQTFLQVLSNMFDKILENIRESRHDLEDVQNMDHLYAVNELMKKTKTCTINFYA